MVEVIADMAPGTLGFRVSGRLTRENYSQVLAPPMRKAVAAGERLRALYAIGPELRMEPGALWEDLKLEVDLGIKHRNAWERIAVVTDLDWLWRAFGLFLHDGSGGRCVRSTKMPRAGQGMAGSVATAFRGRGGRLGPACERG